MLNLNLGLSNYSQDYPDSNGSSSDGNHSIRISQSPIQYTEKKFSGKKTHNLGRENKTVLLGAIQKKEIKPYYDVFSDQRNPLEKKIFTVKKEFPNNSFGEGKKTEMLSGYKPFSNNPSFHSTKGNRTRTPYNHRLVSFNKQITESARCHDIKQCKELIKKIKAEGLVPDAYSYNPILNLFVRLKNEIETYAVFNEMKKEGVRPDQMTYTSLINLYVKKENEEKAYAVFNEMKEEGIQPDQVTYTSLINLYVQTENEEKAYVVFKEMKEERIQPNLVTYNSLINLYVQTKNEEKAYAVFNEMKKEGIQPDILTYTSLINLYVQTENEEKAYAVFNEMKEEGIQPDLVTYNSLINLYVQTENEEKAYAIFNEMKKEGIQPDQVTYNSLINLYVKKENEEKAYAVFNEMKKEGIQPDLLTYTSLINLNMQTENEKNANAVFNEMKEEGIQPDLVTYISMIDLLVKLNRLDDAKTLFNSQFIMNNLISKDGLDVHGLSQGAAFAALAIFIESHCKGDSFILITGKGLHSNHDLYKMRNFLEGKIKKDVHGWDFKVDGINDGRLTLFKSESTDRVEPIKKESFANHKQKNKSPVSVVRKRKIKVDVPAISDKTPETYIKATLKDDDTDSACPCPSQCLIQ